MKPENERTQKSEKYICFLEIILKAFGKSFCNVVALVKNNCSVNQIIRNKMRIQLLRSVSHRFQLTVKVIIAADDVTVLEVNQVMTKSCMFLVSAKLRRLTLLRPRVRNDTQWSSTFETLMRYKQLRVHVMRFNNADIDSSLLNVAVEQWVDNQVMQHGYLDVAKEKLQMLPFTLRKRTLMLFWRSTRIWGTV